jgi:hypothetical protein
MSMLQLVNQFSSGRFDGTFQDLQADMTKMMNRLSSLQVDAGKITGGILNPTQATLMLRDANEDGKMDLSTTRAQRQHPVDWLNEHLRGLQTAPEEKLDGLAKTAKLYLLLSKVKCSDDR